MATTPALIGAINVGLAQIVAADTTTKKTVLTAGASGSKVVSLVAATDDTAAENLQVWIKRGGTYYLLGTVNVPLLSGAGAAGAVAAVDLLNATSMPGLPLDNDGQHYLLLKSGDSLEVSAMATITAAKTTHLVAMGGDL